VPVQTKTYKFRFYPNKLQQQQLALEFGHARFIYNWALDMRNKAYKRRKESLNYVSISKLLTQIKKTSRYQWLNQAASSCATQKLRDLDRAFTNFFEGRTSYPRFKKRLSAQSVRYQLDQRNIAKTFSNTPGKERLTVTKLGQLKVRWSRPVEGVPKMVAISKNASGHYYLSLSAEVEIKPLPVTNRAVGVDLGIKDVVITSDGERSGAPKYTRHYENALARAQRSLARKKKGSNRRHRQRIKVAKIHVKITNSRVNFLHHISTKLINENQVISLEDLNIKGMVRNAKLAKSISDSAMSMLKQQLEYKAKWYGRELIVIDRWFPSSKTCNQCKHVLSELSLSVRTWQCPECGTEHDRDINAAINILVEGLKQYREGHGNWPIGLVLPANEQGVSRAA